MSQTTLFNERKGEHEEEITAAPPDSRHGPEPPYEIRGESSSLGYASVTGITVMTRRGGSGGGGGGGVLGVIGNGQRARFFSKDIQIGFCGRSHFVLGCSSPPVLLMLCLATPPGHFRLWRFERETLRCLECLGSWAGGCARMYTFCIVHTLHGCRSCLVRSVHKKIFFPHFVVSYSREFASDKSCHSSLMET